MRRIIVLVILILFNAVFIYGINYANKLMDENNFMIYFKDKPVKDPEEVIEDEEVITDYNGEDISIVANKIEKYFDKTDLSGYGKFIAEKSVKKEVNPYLVSGIILESTLCKNECTLIFKECNNVSGLKGEPGCFGGSYKKYKSINDGILDLIDTISEKYSDKEMQNPNKMYKSYGKNAVWAFKVSKFMEELNVKDAKKVNKKK